MTHWVIWLIGDFFPWIPCSWHDDKLCLLRLLAVNLVFDIFSHGIIKSEVSVYLKTPQDCLTHIHQDEDVWCFGFYKQISRNVSCVVFRVGLRLRINTAAQPPGRYCTDSGSKCTRWQCLSSKYWFHFCRAWGRVLVIWSSSTILNTLGKAITSLLPLWLMDGN